MTTMNEANILGIDLSLTGTAVAMLSPVTPPPGTAPFCGVEQDLPNSVAAIYHHRTGFSGLESLTHYAGMLIQTRTQRALPRWQAILDGVLLYARQAHKVVIEQYAFSTNQAYKDANVELGGIIRYHLQKMGHMPIEVMPTQLKKFISGRGNAEKFEMIEAINRRYGIQFEDDNMADAFGLAQIGQALESEQECEAQCQREVIRGIKYPSEKPPRQARRQKVRMLFRAT